MLPSTDWDDTMLRQLENFLPGALPDFLRSQRWFGGKAGVIRSVSLSEVVPVRAETIPAYITLISVEYAAGGAQHYALPLTPISPPGGTKPILSLGEGGEPAYVLGDALYDETFSLWLLRTLRKGGTFPGRAGEIAMVPGRALESLWRGSEPISGASVLQGEQSNTSIRYGDKFILKFFRRAEEGVCLDQEIGSFLTDKVGFQYSPPLAGAIEYRRPGSPLVTMAILQGFVRNQGDAWQYTLESIEQFLQRVGHRSAAEVEDSASTSLEQMASVRIPRLAKELLAGFLDRAELLGKRTAGLHRALASDATDPDFAPEIFSPVGRQALAASMIRLSEEAIQLLSERLEVLPPSSRENAARVLALQDEILSRFSRIETIETMGMRIRIHGDYHLGQVLVTGSDFAIIDFEGEPERPLAERRMKRSAFADVAGMLRSFHYAASSFRLTRTPADPARPDHEANRTRWLKAWRGWISAAFLQAYLRDVAGAAFLPQGQKEANDLLGAFLLEKAIYEMGYELKTRPDWIGIPLGGILDLLETDL